MIRKKIKRTVRISRYVFYRETLIDKKAHLWAFLGSFAGIGIISYLQEFSLSTQDNLFLIGSFGASSVLVYGITQSPFSQPRNLVGGHVISALAGVTVHMLFPEVIWIAAPLAVSLSIVLMQITKTLHPPGGATALIAVIGTEKVKSLGYLYVLSPVFTGCFILLFTALIFNNMEKKYSYPARRIRIPASLRKMSFSRKKR